MVFFLILIRLTLPSPTGEGFLRFALNNHLDWLKTEMLLALFQTVYKVFSLTHSYSIEYRLKMRNNFECLLLS